MNHPPRLITNQSSLRRIPPYVTATDKVVFDGIRYSLEIVDGAHRRLRETLWQISSHKEHDHVDLYVEVVSDAWVIIDCFNRLQTLCASRSEYLNHDYCRAYAEALSPVIKLRNAIQHLKGRLEKIVADKESAWGVISWASCTGNPPTTLDLHCFSAGTLRNSEMTVVTVPDRLFAQPVDAITLTADKSEVSISDLMLLTSEFVAHLEENLSAIFPVDIPHTRDAYLRVPTTFNGTGIEPARLTVAIIAKDGPLAQPLNRAARRAVKKRR